MTWQDMATIAGIIVSILFPVYYQLRKAGEQLNRIALATAELPHHMKKEDDVADEILEIHRRPESNGIGTDALKAATKNLTEIAKDQTRILHSLNSTMELTRQSIEEMRRKIDS